MQFIKKATSPYKVQRDDTWMLDEERLVSENLAEVPHIQKYKVRILNIQANNLFPKFSQSYKIKIVWDTIKSVDLKEVQGFVAAWSYQDTFVYKTTSLHNLEDKFLEFQCCAEDHLIGCAKISFKDLVTSGATQHHQIVMKLVDGSQRGTIDASVEFTLLESTPANMREDAFSNVFAQ
mmetsp:Transcript_16064/g.22330  ORF Transcript_16064/g.22330 Transcript_16064/m.22330 type:complete len:178 (-) Transcript_16064:46-579(-)